MVCATKARKIRQAKSGNYEDITFRKRSHQNNILLQTDRVIFGLRLWCTKICNLFSQMLKLFKITCNPTTQTFSCSWL